MAMLAAMLVATQGAPPPETEMLVVAERMKRLKLETRTDRRTGVARCVMTRRSGDPVFDALMCDAVLACAKTVTTRPAMEACLAPTLEGHALDLAARRAAALKN
ncbi:hypothetical protein GCM10007973_19150 [Polymorphobacter multimanifer]|nr:hypothetical protein GCM10007973_19150 [Polymorphobacter multimanifer]